MPFDGPCGDKKEARINTVAGLVEKELVAEKDRPSLEALAKTHAIGLSPEVLQTIKDCANPLLDPVGRQYVPSVQEREITSEERLDPIGDEAHSPVAGIVHRYPDRVLLKITNACAVYCRFCFRREMVGPGSERLSAQDLEQAMRYIEGHPKIYEVILTGGDPLVLSSRRLEKVLKRLDNIKHVQVIRTHTRTPIANPSSIKNTICTVFKSISTPLFVVLHVNHPHELTPQVEEKIGWLRDAGCTLLAQSVLLKGVNNDTGVLENLFRKLVSMQVKPYYLHHPDLAKGTNHFRISLQEGLNLMKSLQARVSGICLPTYMLDIPGGYGKVPVDSARVKKLENGTYSVEDYQGNAHIYPPQGQKEQT
jgi:lysine 2,3-aminomutase